MSESKITDETIQGIKEAIVYVHDKSSDFLDSYLENEENDDANKM